MGNYIDLDFLNNAVSVLREQEEKKEAEEKEEEETEATEEIDEKEEEKSEEIEEEEDIDESFDKQSYDALQKIISKAGKVEVAPMVYKIGNMIATFHSELNDTIGLNELVKQFQKGYNEVISAKKIAGK
jgi:hypothetical protein